jgi:hypothetical protein
MKKHAGDERRFHAAADVFPLLEGAEFNDLVESMRRHGFDPRHPIALFEDAILEWSQPLFRRPCSGC